MRCCQLDHNVEPIIMQPFISHHGGNNGRNSFCRNWVSRLRIRLSYYDSYICQSSPPPSPRKSENSRHETDTIVTLKFLRLDLIPRPSFILLVAVLLCPQLTTPPRCEISEFASQNRHDRIVTQKFLFLDLILRPLLIIFAGTLPCRHLTPLPLRILGIRVIKPTRL